MTQTFYSNGKLMLTGEYLVLDGAKAFALPTRFGQDLKVTPSHGRKIRWTSFDAPGSIWFAAEIPFDAIASNAQTSDAVQNTLLNILHTAAHMNPSLLLSEGYEVQTRLTFPRAWGLGSSSTLVNNIAQWLGIDAYELLWKSFGGSGYDIACAQNDSAVLYQKMGGAALVETVDFDTSFADHLYFVYLNRKQDSKSAIAAYKNKRAHLGSAVGQANTIADAISKTKNLTDFTTQLDAYENLLAPLLETPTAKQQWFADFDGTIKSLGAWGGDFVLAASQQDPTPYFHRKGFETVIRYRDMIL